MPGTTEHIKCFQAPCAHAWLHVRHQVTLTLPRLDRGLVHCSWSVHDALQSQHTLQKEGRWRSHMLGALQQTACSALCNILLCHAASPSGRNASMHCDRRKMLGFSLIRAVLSAVLCDCQACRVGSSSSQTLIRTWLRLPKDDQAHEIWKSTLGQ